MRRVLKELRRVRKSMDAEAVHDLRVAIRRCRAIATIMQEVDAHPAWRAMKRLPRRLFRTLGQARDIQVLEDWIRRISPATDPLRAKLLGALEERLVAPRRQLQRAARRFNENAWRRLARTLTARARLVRPNGLTAQCMALERYEELQRLHARVMRTVSPEAWHALRVGLKRFRYVVESVLPRQSVEWDNDLGEMQGLLGEIHDLDVLTSWIAHESNGVRAALTVSVRRAVNVQRQARIARFRKRTSGETSLLRKWRSGLPEAGTIERAGAARIRTTAHMMDPHPRKTAAISRLALQLFDRLATSGAEPRFRHVRLRAALRAAAQLQAIDVRGRRGFRPKAARNFLRTVPVPMGWTSQEWNVVAEVVRYQRGAEPTPQHKQFATIAPRHQERVRGLAGVLRLARHLHQSGVTMVGVQVNDAGRRASINLEILPRPTRRARRLRAAARLLESYLRRPMHIENLWSSSVSVPLPARE